MNMLRSYYFITEQPKAFLHFRLGDGRRAESEMEKKAFGIPVDLCI